MLKQIWIGFYFWRFWEIQKFARGYDMIATNNEIFQWRRCIFCSITRNDHVKVWNQWIYESWKLDGIQVFHCVCSSLLIFGFPRVEVYVYWRDTHFLSKRLWSSLLHISLLIWKQMDGFCWKVQMILLLPVGWTTSDRWVCRWRPRLWYFGWWYISISNIFWVLLLTRKYQLLEY